MATTATVTLTSDLLSAPMSISSTTTCMKAGTEADSLDQMDMGYIELASGTQKNLLDATALGVGKANKVYICNNSTDETYFIEIMINAMVVGKLYAGDWMFLPWSAIDADADIEVTAHTGTNKITYILFHEGRTLLAVD
tara:strand:+ start:104 stop:520 length:417 start_codon:yes stop_codon:yes gene_type:complete